jgi:hypothetical protein
MPKVYGHVKHLNTVVLNFKNFIKEWEGYFQHAAPGKFVTVHQPGHELHGKKVNVVRRLPTEAGVEEPHAPGKLHWFNCGDLK